MSVRTDLLETAMTAFATNIPPITVREASRRVGKARRKLAKLEAMKLPEWHLFLNSYYDGLDAEHAKYMRATLNERSKLEAQLEALVQVLSKIKPQKKRHHAIVTSLIDHIKQCIADLAYDKPIRPTLTTFIKQMTASAATNLRAAETELKDVKAAWRIYRRQLEERKVLAEILEAYCPEPETD